MNIRVAVSIPTLLALSALPALGYEQAFAPTPAGKVEAKTIPAAKIITAKAAAGYFDNANRLFGTLFGYIRKNEVAMTVPVEADVDGGSLSFYLGSKDRVRDLPNTDRVTVRDVPERTVASAGARGRYTRANFEKTHKLLVEWLKTAGVGEAAGEGWAKRRARRTRCTGTVRSSRGSCAVTRCISPYDESPRPNRNVGPARRAG